LAFLREPNLEVFNNINRRDYAHTIYPPAAQFIFYLVTLTSPTLTSMKTFMMLFEGLTAWALIKLLLHLGYRREQVLLYAWCPMLVWEIGGSGHLDAAAMALITLALLFRFRNRPVCTGLFLGLAVITKMYPLVLFPALYRRGDWKMPATLAAVIAMGYACYLSAGWAVFGFLTGYADEEGLASASRDFITCLLLFFISSQVLFLAVLRFGLGILVAERSICSLPVHSLGSCHSMSRKPTSFRGPVTFFPQLSHLPRH
jgi:hypothetical protein